MAHSVLAIRSSVFGHAAVSSTTMMDAVSAGEKNLGA
jgi:hypothetical protein